MSSKKLMAVCVLAAGGGAWWLQVGHAQTAPARTIVEDAAKALGGVGAEIGASLQRSQPQACHLPMAYDAGLPR